MTEFLDWMAFSLPIQTSTLLLASHLPLQGGNSNHLRLALVLFPLYLIGNLLLIQRNQPISCFIGLLEQVRGAFLRSKWNFGDFSDLHLLLLCLVLQLCAQEGLRGLVLGDDVDIGGELMCTVSKGGFCEHLNNVCLFRRNWEGRKSAGKALQLPLLSWAISHHRSLLVWPQLSPQRQIKGLFRLVIRSWVRNQMISNSLWVLILRVLVRVHTANKPIRSYRFLQLFPQGFFLLGRLHGLLLLVLFTDREQNLLLRMQGVGRLLLGGLGMEARRMLLVRLGSNHYN